MNRSGLAQGHIMLSNAIHLITGIHVEASSPLVNFLMVGKRSILSIGSQCQILKEV